MYVGCFFWAILLILLALTLCIFQWPCDAFASLATGWLPCRAEQASHNPTAEAEHLTQAAQYFIEAETDGRRVDDLGFEDNIIDAVQCYEQAVEIYLRLQRSAFAATLYIELAGVLRVFGRTEQAADYFGRAATLLADSPLASVQAINQGCAGQVCLCHVCLCQVC